MRWVTYFLILAVCSLLPNAQVFAQNDANALIRLYIPIQSQSLQKDIQVLSSELNAAGLGVIQPIAAQFWTHYQEGIRDGRMGIYLAAPHFSAWAVKKHNFVPLVRIAEPLKYVIAVRRDESRFFEINDLNRRQVCAQQPLNLDYLLVNQAFANPLLSANVVNVASVFKEIQDKSKRCDGFALSDHQFKKISSQQSGQYIRLQQSAILKNYSIVAAPSIDRVLLSKLRTFLLSNQQQKLLLPLLSQFAQRTDLLQAKKWIIRKVNSNRYCVIGNHRCPSSYYKPS